MRKLFIAIVAAASLATIQSSAVELPNNPSGVGEIIYHGPISTRPTIPPVRLAQCPPGWGCWSWPESGDSVDQGHAYVPIERYYGAGGFYASWRRPA